MTDARTISFPIDIESIKSCLGGHTTWARWVCTLTELCSLEAHMAFLAIESSSSNKEFDYVLRDEYDAIVADFEMCFQLPEEFRNEAVVQATIGIKKRLAKFLGPFVDKLVATVRRFCIDHFDQYSLTPDHKARRNPGVDFAKYIVEKAESLRFSLREVLSNPDMLLEAGFAASLESSLAWDDAPEACENDCLEGVMAKGQENIERLDATIKAHTIEIVRLANLVQDLRNDRKGNADLIKEHQDSIRCLRSDIASCRDEIKSQKSILEYHQRDITHELILLARCQTAYTDILLRRM